MNELYEKTLEVNGKIYHYDPDSDTYYAHCEETAISKYMWIVICLAMCLVAYYAEYVI